MGKHNVVNNNKTDTKVLFKKSNITIRTHSRTCSDASQIARNGIMQIKKTISKTNDYYKEGDKVKRDLSVETGFCILRRYYKSKHKRDKCSVQASTAKSKCSTVADTEIESVEDFKPDASACGDSRNKFEIVNQINSPNIDITAMMVENLKNLLNDWIKKHVLEDTETKKKLINVLDSILHSLESKISSTRSSCSTYIVERNGEGFKVRNKKTATNSITCQYCKQKQTSLITSRSSSVMFRKYSRFTIPFPYRHLRIISTLSIPRNLYRKEKVKRKNMVYKVKKVPKKNVALSDNKKEKKVVINVSSCENSPSSKKSMVKCLKTHEQKSQFKRKGIILVPQMFYKSTTEYTSTTEVEDSNNNSAEKKKIHLDTMPSLVKSIYADDPANVTSTDRITTHQNRNDNFTMTEESRPSVKVGNSASNVRFHEAKYECCNTNINTPKTMHKRHGTHSNLRYINQSLEFPNITVPRQKVSKHTGKMTTTECRLHKNDIKISGRRRSAVRKMTPWFKYENIKYKHFTYLYKKTNSKRQENEFLNHFRNVFKYFANYEGKRNIKLEIHCNVYPLFDAEEKKTNINNKEFLNYELQMTPASDCHKETTKVDNAIEYEDRSEHSVKESELNPEIIPLLDGAASQAKYIFKSENSTSKSEVTMKYAESTDRGTVMTGLEVSKELNELKIAIRDLSATAERIVNEHIKRKSDEKRLNNISNVAKTKTLLDNTNETLIKRSNLSKGIQFSNTVAKGQLSSGIKLSKEPKRLEEFTNRLKKRSSSYHVIDSESILKVTDMTSSVVKPKVVNQSKLVNQPRLNKSKSLLQLTTEANKQRLIAFFCDNCRRNDKITYNITNKTPRCRRSPSPNDSSCNLQCPLRSSSGHSPSSENKIYIPVKVSEDSYKGCSHEYCSSVYVDIDKPTITVKKRGGLAFWEGCLYCILLWIPLVVIIYLFYDFVIKNPSKASNSNAKPKMYLGHSKASLLAPNGTKSSRFLLKLSDFGF